jgi:aldose 1-epimerase
VPPTGEQVELRSAGYTATITQLGATLRRLDHRGRPLVRGYAAEQTTPVYSGAVLAPWPNRIADGQYSYACSEHQLPINEPERNTALHGLVHSAPWHVAHRSPAEVMLRHRLRPSPGYPFHLDLALEYGLTEAGLTATLAATNTGSGAAPYGCSIHPYLVADQGMVDDWTLELPASRYLRVDPDRLLPIAVHPVDDTAYDFRTARRMSSVRLDHAFTGIGFDDTGTAYATLRDRAGRGVRVTWDRTCTWVQVHTGDRPESALDRTGLALEPMTCPPDAFRTGIDLVHLQPGQTHTATWRIAAV